MIRNLPNILTITRILFLPFFAASLIYGIYSYALILFIAASVTDGLDGYIARKHNLATKLGGILDPVADKFLILTSFIIMSMYGMIPKWLTIIVISRDLIVVTGCLIIYFVTHDLKIEPTILGKTAIALESVLIGLVLLSVNLSGQTFGQIWFLLTVAIVTAVSGVQYVYRGVTTANIEREHGTQIK
ncbi:MAG TPA: CDP-alcohol phosphatidyltransferase family protein [Nitrospirae bacterium]|nr:putative CDP-diacylglycerol--glycerol-3-phosphate 3-phosphatidyl-transferase 2 [bacterium BMS3Abin10]GBE39054.1 putative CDP-diacylglycerol--glycerol-3-phosphate 3-phosphatidyl-transferase 2 [bacterium BMS3Bbin08]HDH01217.1 CDP-alcohol phosphatidyltransferase family protein [Nitrospirota bacterium]HDH51798.1 CDP-alcohol phosphatidyltransferase family protein [Nitrospirota bacterium]HDK81281.1 CDP-alcohol phosphatidyltransferase family protein [Nitrospirota bacterium]